MKVLITGSEGFIGRHLSSEVSARHSVIRHGRKQINSYVTGSYFQMEVNSQSEWRECLSGVDVVIHLAGLAHSKDSKQVSVDEINVKGTLRLAEQALAEGVNRFIFISTIGVLGNKTTFPFNEKSPEIPHSEYASSKLRAEKELLDLARKTNLEVVIIRPVLVYGDMAPGNFSKLKSLIKKSPILPFGLVNNNRSFISVDNLVSFIQLCVDHPKAKNEVFCISDGVDVSIKEFTNLIAASLSKKVIQLPVPLWLMKYTGRLLSKKDMVEQLVGDLQVDVSKAKRLLGWTPLETMQQAMNKIR